MKYIYIKQIPILRMIGLRNLISNNDFWYIFIIHLYIV